MNEMSRDWRPLAAPGKVVCAALALNAGANILPMCVHLFTDGRLIVPLLVISVLVLFMAGLVAQGRRWAPLLGGCVALLTTALDIAQPDNWSALLHPSANPGHFGNVSLLLVSALVALVMGIVATPRTDHRLTAQLS